MVGVNENGLCLAGINVISMQNITGGGHFCKNLLLAGIPFGRARSDKLTFVVIAVEFRVIRVLTEAPPHEDEW